MSETKKLKGIGTILVIVAILLEIVIFPSGENLAGCAMTFLTWYVFAKIGLNKKLIKEHLFSWLIFLSMSMYRILPLFATLLEFKPITYKFELPYETFTGETFLYIISALAFFLATKKTTNNIIQRVLDRFDFYDMIPVAQIWLLGIFGFILRLYFYKNGDAKIGDTMGKFLTGFLSLQYAPIILFFPSLYGKGQKIITFNFFALVSQVFLFALSLSSNSRLELIEPFGIFILLLMVALLNSSKPFFKIAKPKYFILLLITVFVLSPIISNFSSAMLATRKIREDVSKKELLQKTWEAYGNDDEQKSYVRSNNDIIRNSDGWSEEYLSNFALNRYANIRITDLTLFHAKRIGYNNEIMQMFFYSNILRLFPTPILMCFHLNIDKKEIISNGDFLYNLSTGYSYAASRVTSHLADGLATFGNKYFILQFILFFIQFKLVDCFLIWRRGRVIYSFFGLLLIFSIFGMFRNANGCFGEVSFILRGFWQDLLLFILVLKLSGILFHTRYLAKR
ncbi:MAG: hypothetical protein LKG25_02760 [Prevotella sp.]|jgi:hypothetical protein|nr:hypothetical protein [Prevotella sp.]MCI1281503.1 hypothetical protein [Prevotella sp.]